MCDMFQEQIARRVTEGIVDQLESIQIEEEQRDLVTFDARRLQWRR